MLWEELKLLEIIISYIQFTFTDEVKMIRKEASLDLKRISKILNFMSDITKKILIHYLLSVDMDVLQQNLES